MINRRTFLKQIMLGGAAVLHAATITKNTLASEASPPLVPAAYLASLQLETRSGRPATDLARRWARHDAALANNAGTQPWTWGRQVLRAAYEAYADAPNGQRLVWYFAKGRMEVTRPADDPHAAGYVSSGMLVRDLVSGTFSTGEHAQQRSMPALLPLVGDAVPAAQTVTYADLFPHTSLATTRRTGPRVGAGVTETLDQHGRIVLDQRFARYNIAIGRYDTSARYNIAKVFDDALGAERIAELAGAPLCEPVWVTVPINNTPTDVLIQLWERRTLVYTPANAENERVAWGDVGQHYVQWRYGTPSNDSFDPRSVLNPAPAQPLADLAPAITKETGKLTQPVGIAVFNLRSGTLHQAKGNRSFSMYSTVKLPIMVTLLAQALRGGRDITPEEDASITAMIQTSDNDATMALLDQIGGATAVNTYLQQIGLNHTTVLDGIWGSSTTTPHDMVVLLGKLANGTILSRDLQTYVLDRMRGVVPEQRWGVGEGAAEGTVALKNGWYPDTDGWGINSIGIVEDGPVLYAVALYSAANPTMDAGVDLINTLARQVRGAVH